MNRIHCDYCIKPRQLWEERRTRNARFDNQGYTDATLVALCATPRIGFRIANGR